jgi:hypothetical protein
MRLVYLPVNQAYVFADAEITVPVGGHYIHQTRQEAVSRARDAGLAVDAEGRVTPLQTGSGGL